MASKVARKKGKEIAKILLDPFFKIEIGAQTASAAPPLGPALGQRGVNVVNFCKEFNKTTSNIIPGATLEVEINVKPDRSYDIDISSPTVSYLLMMAAGIRRPAQNATEGEIAGKISIKHVYEIAKIKSKDKYMVGVPLKDICISITNEARLLGIAVQRDDLNVVELKSFLDERRAIVEEQLKILEEERAAKMLRG